MIQVDLENPHYDCCGSDFHILVDTTQKPFRYKYLVYATLEEGTLETENKHLAWYEILLKIFHKNKHVESGMELVVSDQRVANELAGWATPNARYMRPFRLVKALVDFTFAIIVYKHPSEVSEWIEQTLEYYRERRTDDEDYDELESDKEKA